MTPLSNEQILSLSDNEVVQQIEQDDDFALHLVNLQLEIYQDDTLRQVRTALMQEAINRSIVDCEWRKEWTEEDRQKHRESTYPLAFDTTKVIDIRVRVLARVRCAIKRAFPNGISWALSHEEKRKGQEILKRTKDGDLAYRYRDHDRDGGQYLAGEDAIKAMSDWEPNFSPEFQSKVTKEYNTDPTMPDVEMLIAGILAQEGRLTIEAWKSLLERDDIGTYRSVWTTKDARPKVKQMIKRNRKFALLYRARTEQSARAELLKRANEFNGVNFNSWFKHSKLD